MDQCKKWTVRKKLNYFSKWVSLYATLPTRDHCQVQLSRFVPNTLPQTLVNFTVSSPEYWQTECLWWEAVEAWFNLDLKSFFCIEKQISGVLTWSQYLMDKCNMWIVDEMDMTSIQVCCSWGKFMIQTQNDTPSTIIYTRWGSWHEWLGSHAPMISRLSGGDRNYIVLLSIRIRCDLIIIFYHVFRYKVWPMSYFVLINYLLSCTS